MKGIFLFVLLWVACLQQLMAQNAPKAPVISQAPGNLLTNTTAPGMGTNANLEQLSAELQNLRTTVDQALPSLRAFNQQFSQQGQGLTGALENLLSKNRGSGQSSSAGHQITNVLAALGSLVTTNAQGATAVNPETLRNLTTLEKDLGPVQQLLQSLTLTGTNQSPSSGGILSPTGR